MLRCWEENYEIKWNYLEIKITAAQQYWGQSYGLRN